MERKNKNNSSDKQLILAVSGIIIFLLVCILVVCCVIFYTKDNSIKTNVKIAKVTMNYTNSSNQLVIGPKNIDDANAINMVDGENVFDFTINVKTEAGTKIKYEVVATKDPISTISDHYAKVYLQKFKDSSYTGGKVIMGPVRFDEMVRNGEKIVLDSGTTKVSTTVYYRLILWTDSNYISQREDDNFKLSINVRGDAQ